MLRQPQTFLFFGRSGSGKGTQADLLQKFLKDNDSREIIYIETGRRIRDFTNQEGYTNKMVKHVLETGGLLPEFVPIWIWTDVLMKSINGNEHLVLDGLSRRIPEAPVLDGALKFFGRQRPNILYINVSRDWAKEKLLSRGRGDDRDKEIDERLSWFDTNVLPTMEFFRNSEYYNFCDINGEQPIEDVLKEILEKTGLVIHERESIEA